MSLRLSGTRGSGGGWREALEEPDVKKHRENWRGQVDIKQKLKSPHRGGCFAAESLIHAQLVVILRLLRFLNRTF
jgi:hypothetical protein